MQQVLRKDVLTPPKGVRAACRRGLDLRPEYGGDGLTEGAVSRARSMAEGKSISPQTLKRIKAYHARHTYEKQSSPPSPGYVAYLLWGGAAGRSWANSQADNVQKSEGSRGGHIIGHTRSGKPIYEARTGIDASQSFFHDHAGFTKDDHADAVDFYRLKNEDNDDEDGGLHGFAVKVMDDPIRHSEDPSVAARNHNLSMEAVQAAGAHLFDASLENPAMQALPPDVRSSVGHATHHHNMASFMYRVNDAHKKGLPLPRDLWPDHSQLLSAKKAYYSSDRFFKAEGSRGGHVIGHTKTGKPIYASAEHTHEVYEHFTAGDHADAADAHRVAMAEHNAKARAARGKDSKVVHAFAFAMGHHEFKAQAHDFASRTLAAGHKLWKSGEGSRGGHILGHTKSGKTIYAHAHASYSSIHSSKNGNAGGFLHPNAAGPAAKRAHPSYSAEDHHDASVAHEKHWALSGTRGDEGMAMARIADAHHRAWARGLKKSQGEGSRGGRIIGHTRSGKPIYAGSRGFDEFNSLDHVDAAKAHEYAGQTALAASDKDTADFHKRSAGAHYVIASLKGPPSPSAPVPIGHTKSGKAVHVHTGHGRDHALSKLSGIVSSYTPEDLKNANDHYPKWSFVDHAQARDLLRRHADRLERQAAGTQFTHGPHNTRYDEIMADALNNSRLSIGHGELARTKRNSKLAKSEHGEGSRGGHIIGHTRSGKPIYSLKHDMNQVKGRAAIQASHQLVGYDQHDHADAAIRHIRSYRKLIATKPKRALAHLKLAADHNVIATGRDLMKPVKTPKAEMSGLKASYDTHAGLAAFHLREADMKRKVAPDEALWHYNQVGLHSSQAMGLRGEVS